MIDWTKTAIVAIAGLAGSGKTQWLRQQLQKSSEPIIYFAPRTVDCAVDRHCLALEFPHWQFLEEGQEVELVQAVEQGAIAILELGFYVALASGEELLKALEEAGFPCQRLAFVPEQMASSPWHDWADQIIEVPMPLPSNEIQVWRSPLSGQVFDPASLNIFWDELTAGAYGNIQRAKGIVEIVDGQAFYLDYVAGMEDSFYRELPVEQWLTGRPQRFSGLEVVGTQLDGRQMSNTLLDCCLGDELLDYYQAQIRQQRQDATEADYAAA